jgi:GH43 family beta-xylosidase
MSTGVCVFAGVLIWRTVAAQRDSTCLARPEMHPIGTDLYAFFAFATMRLLDRLNRDCIQMRTAAGIHDLFTLVIFCLVTG